MKILKITSFYWVSILCFLIIGCVPVKSRQEMRQEVVESWKGAHKDDMVVQFGPPNRESKLSDGTTVMVWEEYRGNEFRQWVCRKVFTADTNGQIVDGSIRGC
jgi:hypothetical protein